MRTDLICRVMGASLCLVCFVASSAVPCAATSCEVVDESPDTDSEEQLASAIEAAIPFLTDDGRAWMDGSIDIQDGQNCVSCHQVPSGVWALDSALTSLDQPRNDDLARLIDDAVDFISDPTIGRPAMWSQLLIVLNGDKNSGDIDEPLRNDVNSWIETILESQQNDGRFQAKGQFPSQRRSIDESDAVISMWMIAGLNYYQGNDDLETAQERARQFVKTTDGTSTEWIAWRMLTPIEGDDQREQSFLDRLLTRQRDDGGWGWSEDSVSDPYSTGVALFALRQAGGDADATQQSRDNAVRYLLENQADDGTWKAPSELITKTSSESRDYVYHYWGTAWAVIGLASEYSEY